MLTEDQCVHNEITMQCCKWIIPTGKKKFPHESNFLFRCSEFSTGIKEIPI